MRAFEYLLKESRIQIPNHISPILEEHASSILKADNHVFNNIANAMEEAKKTGNHMPLMAVKHNFGEYLRDKHGLDYKHADFLFNKFNPEDFRNGNVVKNIAENKYIHDGKFKYNIDSKYHMRNNPIISSDTKNKIGNTLKLAGGATTIGGVAYASQ